VYIAEAHATDVWPLGNHITLSSHKSIEERRSAAQMLISQFKCNIPILLDNMDDEFDREYAVWPERFYIVKNGVMEHIFYPTTEFGFDMASMYSLLSSL